MNGYMNRDSNIKLYTTYTKVEDNRNGNIMNNNKNIKQRQSTKYKHSIMVEN